MSQGRLSGSAPATDWRLRFELVVILAAAAWPPPSWPRPSPRRQRAGRGRRAGLPSRGPRWSPCPSRVGLYAWHTARRPLRPHAGGGRLRRGSSRRSRSPRTSCSTASGGSRAGSSRWGRLADPGLPLRPVERPGRPAAARGRSCSSWRCSTCPRRCSTRAFPTPSQWTSCESRLPRQRLPARVRARVRGRRDGAPPRGADHPPVPGGHLPPGPARGPGHADHPVDPAPRARGGHDAVRRLRARDRSPQGQPGIALGRRPRVGDRPGRARDGAGVPGRPPAAPAVCGGRPAAAGCRRPRRPGPGPAPRRCCRMRSATRRSRSCTGGDSPPRWLDAQGRPWTPPAPGSGRCLTEVRENGRLVAGLVHDDALLDQTDFLQAVAAYALTALENRRLTAQVESSLREVSRSRTRIQASGDRERRRIERDLHDGAQQRLVALGIQLELTEDLIRQDRERGLERLHALGGEVAPDAGGDPGAGARGVPVAAGRPGPGGSPALGRDEAARRRAGEPGRGRPLPGRRGERRLLLLPGGHAERLQARPRRPYGHGRPRRDATAWCSRFATTAPASTARTCCPGWA